MALRAVDGSDEVVRVLWNPAAETMSRERLEALQLERMRHTVGRLLDTVPPLGDRLRSQGLQSPRDVRSLGDLGRLPFTTKDDLRNAYPFGLFAVPRERIARIHASSGTRGKPTVVGYTSSDLQVWSEVMARCLAMAGVRPGMVLHNAYGYGLFTGGLGFHQGAELMGCTVVPMSGGFTQRQIMMLQDLGGQVLCCTPSYALNLAEHMEAMGLDAAELPLEVGIFGAEPWTEAMQAELDRRLALRSLNIYGLSEIVGPGVSAECIEARNGAHLQEDHFLAEVVDPATDEPLLPGREGELVLTTLTKEALPMLRYRTGDITSLDTGPCLCGRTLARMARIRGRRDDMLIIRGQNLYPMELERILLALPQLAPHYQLIVDRPSSLDELTVVCEPGEGCAASDLDEVVRRAVKDQTGITVRVQVLGRGEIPRSEGKAVRVVDLRPR